jgi:hypothetical protein
MGAFMSQPAIKTFNTTGPCVPSEHYMLPVLTRQSDVDKMIEGKYYFILHAPRQSGKTTFLEAQTDKINSEGKYYALNCSLMALRGEQDETIAMSKFVARLNFFMKASRVQTIKEKAYIYNSLPGMDDPVNKISIFLNNLCEDLDKELVVFFDEADCLSGSALITFLAQIRESFQIRSQPGNKFPRSMTLVGMRDIRDYLIQVHPEEASKGVASPFNIKKEAFTLPNFTKKEIGALYRQHTKASGQIFEKRAITRAWYWSEGQPWLVNALAYDAVVKNLKNDYTKVVTAEIIDQVARALILNRPVHIDSLMEHLKESRVRRVIDSVIVGVPFFGNEVSDEDTQYVLDLGLLKSENEVFQPANQIYSEIIIRTLTRRLERRVPKELEGRWTDGEKLNMTGLLKAFQKYWRKNAEMLGEPDRLTESTPHLVCFTFIQRVLNGDVDEINREYALGRRRVDLHALYKGISYPVELKTKSPRNSFSEKDMTDSLDQLYSYMGKCGAKEGWLVIFNLDWDKSWDEKITWKATMFKGYTIHIVGC